MRRLDEFTVYLLGPVIGGLAAAMMFTRIIEPMMHSRNACSGCIPSDRREST